MGKKFESRAFFHSAGRVSAQNLSRHDSHEIHVMCDECLNYGVSGSRGREEIEGSVVEKKFVVYINNEAKFLYRSEGKKYQGERANEDQTNGENIVVPEAN